MSPVPTYDAIIVGSGATGGWAAKELTEAGLRVCVLEAGRKLDPESDFTEHQRPFEVKYRGLLSNSRTAVNQPIQQRCYQCDEYTHHLFVDDLENPYTMAEGTNFSWIRGRHVGGRSIMWARQTYRLSDYDLKAASRDGYGDDWPISYKDLEPYYDKVERFIGISGAVENLPQLPDSRFLPPMNMTCGELLLRERVKAKLRRTVTIGRCAILTQDLNGRPKCHFCGPCSRGCRTGSYYSSPASTLPAAEKTGRMTLIPNAVASHILTDKSGKAKGVHYYDRLTKKSMEVYGKVIVLTASTLESTRLLLNSTSPRWPNGLGNSSGVLGHFLMDHVMGGGAGGTLPALGVERIYHGEQRPNGIYIPRFRNITDKYPKFLRGYGYQGGSGQSVWGHAHQTPGFGKGFKESVKNRGPWGIGLGGFGECLARWENYVEIDKDRVDALGIPVIKINAQFGENEKAMVEDMADQAAEMLEAVGAKYVEREAKISEPGLAIHEVGTARMGDDPRKSFLNKFCQSHEVKNLFVTDGSCYVSSACQNPTLTFMALTVRACEYLAGEFKRGNLR